MRCSLALESKDYFPKRVNKADDRETNIKHDICLATNRGRTHTTYRQFSGHERLYQLLYRSSVFLYYRITRQKQDSYDSPRPAKLR